MGTVVVAPYSNGAFEKVLNNGVAWTKVTFAQATKQAVLRPLNPAHTLSVTTLVIHNTPDSTNSVDSADADSEGKAHTLLNEMKTKLNLHFAAAAYHLAADAANEIEADTSADLATAVTMVNECYLDLLAHMIEDGVHYDPDLTVVTGTLATVAGGFASVYALGNIVKAAYNVHRVLTAEAWELAAAGTWFTWNCYKAVWVQLSSNGSLSVRTHS
jgi:hypothetical protein